MKMTQKLFAIALVLTMMLSALPAMASETAAPVTMFGQSWQDFDGADKDTIWNAVEAAVNVDLSLSGVPYNNYVDKINVMVNTGEAPDIFEHWPEGNADVFAQWISEDLLVNLDEYVPEDGSKYPNIANLIYNDQYKNLLFGGQHIMVPWISSAASWGVYIRQDWLDALDLETPKTVEDYYNVMKAFTENDPDGNGANDTYGLCGTKDAYWFMPMYAAYVEKPDWNYNADKTNIEFMYATEGYKEYLGYMEKAYSEGLIVKDFYTKTADLREEDFKTGKCGILFVNVGFANDIAAQMMMINPNVRLSIIDPPTGPAGTNMHGWGGFWGGWSISADTADKDACLALLDYIVSAEGSELTHYGVEGVHYTKNEDGTRTITDENLAARQAEPEDRFIKVAQDDETLPLGFYNWGQWFGPLRSYADGKIIIEEDYSTAPQRELLEIGTEICGKYCKVSDMANVVVDDPEYAEIATKVNDIATAYTMKIITGEISLEDGWAEMLQKLDDAGYAKAQQMAFDKMESIK